MVALSIRLLFRCFVKIGIWCPENARRGAVQVWWRARRRGPRWQQTGRPSWTWTWSPRSSRRARRPKDVQTVYGAESPDYGPVQPYPSAPELLHCQPLAFHIQRGQFREKIRQKEHRMAISFYLFTCHHCKKIKK